ncbi:MAG: prepilin peptidase [Planctomycetes bacterium]|nr:prepilin peptidase [Planctomycetota bacterium]
MDGVTLVFGIFAALFGLAVGSFVNVVVHRLPEGGWRSLLGRSRCPRCSADIAWYDNLPVVAWVLLGARCRRCRTPISARYPVVELSCSLLFLWAWWMQPGPGYSPALIFIWIALAALLALSLIDLELTILPDEITIPGLLFGPLLALIAPHLLADTWGARQLAPWIEHERLRALVVSVLGVGTGAASVALIRAAGTWAYSSVEILQVPADARPRRLDTYLASAGMKRSSAEVQRLVEDQQILWKAPTATNPVLVRDTAQPIEPGGELRIRNEREAMGFGDVKLQGAIGGCVGPEGSLLAFAVASVLGALLGIANIARLYVFLVQRRRARQRPRSHRIERRPTAWSVANAAGRLIPFGPFLAAGAAIVLLNRREVLSVFAAFSGLHG